MDDGVETAPLLETTDDTKADVDSEGNRSTESEVETDVVKEPLIPALDDKLAV